MSNTEKAKEERGRRAHKQGLAVIVASRYTTWELAQTNVKPFTPRKETANKRPPPGEQVFCTAAILQFKGHERLALSRINALFALEAVAVFSNYRNHKMATLQANDNATNLTWTSAISPATYL